MSNQQQPEQKQKAQIVVQDRAPSLSLQPRNFDELWRFAAMIAETDFVPLALRGKPGSVIACVQYGNEVGLPPMTSLQGVAVINGRPSIWGETFNMLLQSHPAMEWMKELGPDEAMKAKYGECTIKRKDRKDSVTRRYTVEMAERARLWGGKGDSEEKRKKSVWYTNPGRMLQMRARSLCGKDCLPEATGPMSMREETEDYVEIPQSLPNQSTPIEMPTTIEKPDVKQPTSSEPSGKLVDAEFNAEGKNEIRQPTLFEKLQAWLQVALEEQILATTNEITKGFPQLSDKEGQTILGMLNDRKREIIDARASGSPTK